MYMIIIIINLWVFLDPDFLENEKSGSKKTHKW